MSYPFLIAGLTGSIGSGKSTVARLFEELGAHVIDADILAREAVRPETNALTELVSTFGTGILLPDGSLNRKKLASLIFPDKTQRTLAEKIIHPQVRSLFLKQLESLKQSRTVDIVIYAVPLLFESGYKYSELDTTIVVTATREQCLERVQSRDNSSRKEAEQRYDAQLSSEEKAKRADLIISNNGSVEDLRQKTKLVYEELQKLVAQKRAAFS